ncbi:MAG: TonB family protein [Caulobacter sp.]
MGRPRTGGRGGEKALAAGVSLGLHAAAVLAFVGFVRTMPGLSEPPAMEAALFEAVTPSPEPSPSAASSERRAQDVPRQRRSVSPIRPRQVMVPMLEPLMAAPQVAPQPVETWAVSSVTAVAATTSAASAPAGGGAPVQVRGEAAKSHDPYAAQVLSWIEARKTMPEALRRRRTQGVVVVAFTLDRFGRMSRASIVESSGDHALDAAAMDLLNTAAPFPRAPRDADWNRRRFETPISYAVKG